MKRLLAKVLILLMIFNVGGGILPNESHATQLVVDSSLRFNLEPYVAQQGLDYITVQFKVSRASCIYYQAVPSGTTVTNDSVIMGGNYKDFLFGATSYVTFDNLQPGVSYDLCFVLVDYPNYKVASNTPYKLLNQQTAQQDTTTPNGIGSATYANASAPGDAHANGAHIYLFLEAPNSLPTPVQPDSEDIIITFPSSSTGASGPRILTDMEYDIQPMAKGSKVLDVAIKPEAFITGTLSNYTVTTPDAINVSIIDHNAFNPAISHNTSMLLGLNSTVFTAETYPVMYPRQYVEDPEGDYIWVQLDRSIPVGDLPLYTDFTIMASGLPSNPITAVTAIDDGLGNTSSFKLKLSPTAQAYVRSLSGLPFDITYYSPMAHFIMVNDYNNPYYVKYDSIASDIDNEISSIKFFDGTNYTLTATRQSGTKDFTLKVPYIGLEQAYYKDFLSAAKITLASPQSYANTIMDGGLLVQVAALNGEMAYYMLTFVPDNLTLSGLTFGGTPVTTFSPFQNPSTPYQINTSTLYTMSTLPALAASYNIQAGTQCTISSPVALSGTGNFQYTITLSDGLTTPTTKTYYVQVLYSAGTTPTTPSDKDKTTAGSTAAAPTNTPVVPGSDPTQPYDPFKALGNTPPTPDQIIQEINKLTGLINPQQSGNLSTLTNNFNIVFDSITNGEQAYQTLGAMDDVLSKLKLNTADPIANANMANLAEELTLSTESKLLLINNPNQQLDVLTQFVEAAQTLEASSNIPLTDMNQSVGEMLQKTALSFGTGEVKAPIAGEPVLVNKDFLDGLIKKQTEALKALNDLQDKFFSEGSRQPIKPEIRIAVTGAGSSEGIAVELEKDTVDLLKAKKIETLAVNQTDVEMRVPVSDLKPAAPVEIDIEQRPTPVVSQPLPETPRVIYDFVVQVNGQPLESFTKPITLSFEVSAFGHTSADGGGLAVERFNEVLNVWEPVGGILDPQTGTIFVKRTHLSQYTVLKTKKSFSDADNSWAKEEINAMLSKGIVSDTAKFEPKSILTRGEFAQWIANAYGLKVSDKGLPFKDVPKNSKYYSAIAAVYQQGILQGSKGKFNPDKALTQNELAAALGKVLVSFDNKQKSDKVTSKYLSKLKTTQVASWAEDDMALLMELGMAVDAKSGSSGITKEAAASAFMKFYRS